MKVKIAIAHTNRVVEIESRDIEQVRSAIEEMFQNSRPIVWLEDADGTQIGIPRDMLAFVEFEGSGGRSEVGFAAGG